MKRPVGRGALLASLLMIPSVANAGPLDPPGAPTPTANPAEPRIPITGPLPVTISTSGSHYLTSSLSGVSGEDGITIVTNNVTIDLNGFALVGVPGSGNGITVNGFRENIAVVNGTVTRWGGDGVGLYRENMGTPFAAADHGRLERLNLTGNDGDGAHISSGFSVLQCTAAENGEAGIRGLRGNVFADCTAQGNSAAGFSLGTFGGVIRGCASLSNGGAGIAAAGHVTIESCTATSNGGDGIDASGGDITVRGCTVAANGAMGIDAGSESLVVHSNVSENFGDGIRVNLRSVVLENDSSRNGRLSGSERAGIRVDGSENRIERNNVTANGRGLEIGGVHNIVRDNSVSRSTSQNYVIAPDNQLALTLWQLPETIEWPAHVTLAGSLTGTAGEVGIAVAASDVTIDLGGHALIGVPGSLAAIQTMGNGFASTERVRIHGGSVHGWDGGGIDLTGGGGHRIESVAVENCGGDGIVVDERTAITDCTAYGNSEAGIRLTGQANLVDGNSMIGNSIGLDVDAGGNVIVRNRAGDNEADNYDIMGTNEVGTIGSLGTDPWANVGF